MSLEKPINIRLDIEQKQRYEKDAAQLGIPLATYLRQQLATSYNISEEISALRRSIQQSMEMLEENNGGSRSENGSEDSNMSIMLEMLLLLRQIAQPERKRLAQEELKRLGYRIWNSEK